MSAPSGSSGQNGSSASSGSPSTAASAAATHGVPADSARGLRAFGFFFAGGAGCRARCNWCRSVLIRACCRCFSWAAVK